MAIPNLAGERCWPLPLWKEYRKQLKSVTADFMNVGGRPAGTITAAWFLREFVGESRWAHLDIAGTAYGKEPLPYHGYYYKILTSQGKNVPGGKYDYIINGNMIAGFALAAWPADYGSSGIMTFVVSHHGMIYEKDLGEKTSNIVKKMDEFNPDDTWTPVEEE